MSDVLQVRGQWVKRSSQHIGQHVHTHSPYSVSVRKLFRQPNIRHRSFLPAYDIYTENYWEKDEFV